MSKKSIEKLSPTRKVLIISGIIFVAGASYWYFTRPNETNEKDESPENDDQETPVSIGQTIPFEPKVQQDDVKVDEDIPFNNENDQQSNHIEQQVDETPIIEPEPEPVVE